MELCHYSLGTVKRALSELGKLDWIREHREYSVARQRELITYQISPRVIWITPDNIDMAEQLWNSASLYRNEMFNEQPTPESESEPTTESRTRTSVRTTTTTSSKKPQKAQISRLKPAAQDAGKEQSQQAQTHQRNAPNSATEQIPPPPAIGACRNPLPSDYAESLAMKIADDLGTRITQARQLIKQFDTARVETALQWLEKERAARAVAKPFGLLKWWLTNQVIMPDDQPQPQQAESLSGKYKDYFER